MKKLLFILSLMISSLLLAQTQKINECKTDIYFGNGVWNKQYSRDDCDKDSAAECSVRELNDLINKEIIKDDPKLKANYGEVKLQYNWSYGKMIDLLETFYQLKEAGQISEKSFFILVDELMGKQVSAISDENLLNLRQQIISAITTAEEQDVNNMLVKYYNTSFQYSHRVLLVSHSQGNMFANRVYAAISPTGYQNYFANLQVASPASEVKAKLGDYVTGYIDPVINTIPGSMQHNADLDLPGGHKFVEAYLASQDTRTKIIQKIQQLLAALDTLPSQWETNQEFNKDTMNYRITVKHRFDPNAVIDEEVFPFNTSQKLYTVNYNGTPTYVKASCGGTSITLQNDTYWLINNPEEEKIKASKCLDTQYFDLVTNTCKDYSSYKYDYNGTVEFKATGIRYDYHYEGGYINSYDYYDGGHIVYDKTSNVEATKTIYYPNFRRELGLPNATESCETVPQNPAGSYLLLENKIVFLGNNTFERVQGRIQVGGGMYQNCFLGFLYNVGEYFPPDTSFDEEWIKEYKGPDVRENGGVGYEIWTTSYKIIQYGTVTGVK
ncbi:hypothetical protein [Sulfurimonas sp. HSL-1716]|uniref:hypothetical protein n=1 Tax=Hydrocurvibacter sulfurireducens TaxID=3131937 RepID=UPI0031F8DA5D